MLLHDASIQALRFDAHLHQPLALQTLKNAIQHASATPCSTYRAAAADPPLAPVGRNIKNRIEHLEIAQPYVAALARQQIRDLLKWDLYQLHGIKHLIYYK